MNSNTKFAIAFISFLLLLATIIVAVSRWNDIRGLFTSPEMMQQTLGTVISSKSECRTSKSGSANHFVITYEYKINNQVYVSSQVTFGPTGSPDNRFAQDYVQKYPSGSAVTVFYLSNDPSFSVLEPQVKDQGLVFFVIALFLLPIISGWGFISWIAENMYFG